MTVILGIIGNESCVIASDSRLMKSVNLVDGKPIEDVQIESDDFDKTFTTNNGRIKGGVAGLEIFSGKYSTDHIKEILNAHEENHSVLEIHLDNICQTFKAKLDLINESEVRRGARNVDILIGTFRDAKPKEFVLYKIHFVDNNGEITYSYDSKSTKNSKNWDWSIIGDPAAVHATQARCNELYTSILKSGKKDKKKMDEIAKMSLYTGKIRSSNYLNSQIQCCGGKTKLIRI